MGKYDFCIRKPEKAPPTNHTLRDYDATMPRLAFCEKGDFPFTPLRVIARHVKRIPVDYQPHTELHVHDQDELYVYVSEEPGALEAEMTIGEANYTIHSPAVVLLPKEVPHKYAIKKGHGFVFILLQTGTVDTRVEERPRAAKFPTPPKSSGEVQDRRSTMGKYKYCIKKPYDSTSEYHEAHHTKKHHDEAMPRLSFCGDGYFPESPVRVVVRQIKSVPADYEPHIDLHTHDVDELYVFVSEEKDGLEAEVGLGDEVYSVRSPVTVLLPKGVPHRYSAKKGHGFLFTITPISCADHYNKHTFPYKK
jgi:mannose-6-phosphate isomerase-like protein (cupin superfamily)